MATKYHINPRFRAYGKARIDVTRRAINEQEWQSQWREPMNDFPFATGAGWQFSFDYKVDDFAAEVGFFIDVLGFPVRAFSPSYAQFTSPGGEICFGVLATSQGEESTPPDSIRLYLNVHNIQQASKELIRRGIAYETTPGADQSGTPVHTGYFRSPHGVIIELWNDAGTEPAWQEDEGVVLDEDSLSDQDTDRLIDELLGLSDTRNQPSEERDAELDGFEISGDVDPETEFKDSLQEEDDASESSSEISRLVDESLQPGSRSHGTSIAWGADRQARHSSNSKRPAESARRNSPNSWPAMNDQKTPELTYQQIDEELPEDDI